MENIEPTEQGEGELKYNCKVVEGQRDNEGNILAFGVEVDDSEVADALKVIFGSFDDWVWFDINETMGRTKKSCRADAEELAEKLSSPEVGELIKDYLKKRKDKQDNLRVVDEEIELVQKQLDKLNDKRDLVMEGFEDEVGLFKVNLEKLVL